MAMRPDIIWDQIWIKVSFMYIYNYLEIQFWNMQSNICQEGIKLCALKWPKLCNFENWYHYQ